jgi:hypothetical protein
MLSDANLVKSPVLHKKMEFFYSPYVKNTTCKLPEPIQYDIQNSPKNNHNSQNPNQNNYQKLNKNAVEIQKKILKNLINIMLI